jgi:hypothetical protein
VAGGAGVDLHLRLRGARMNDIAARARDGGVGVLGMYSFFHVSGLSKKTKLYYTESRTFGQGGILKSFKAGNGNI